MSGYGSMGPSESPPPPRKTADAQRDAISGLDKVARLEERVDKLSLICAALWELVKERGKFTEEDLAARVAILVSQGKMSHNARPCAKCGRPIAPRHHTCMYCGTPQAVEGMFESL